MILIDFVLSRGMVFSDGLVMEHQSSHKERGSETGMSNLLEPHEIITEWGWSSFQRDAEQAKTEHNCMSVTVRLYVTRHN